MLSLSLPLQLSSCWILPPIASHPKFRAFSGRSFPRHERNSLSRVLRSSHSFAVVSCKLCVWSCSFPSGSARCKANNVLYAQILLYYLALFRTTRAHTHFIIILMQITNVCCNLGRHIYRCTIERYDFRFHRECRRIR